MDHLCCVIHKLHLELVWYQIEELLGDGGVESWTIQASNQDTTVKTMRWELVQDKKSYVKDHSCSAVSRDLLRVVLNISRNS